MFGADETRTIDGIEAPVPQGQTTGEKMDAFVATLHDAGIETGIPGAVLVLVGVLALLAFYWLAWRLAQAALFARYVEGVVVDTEYSPGGRFAPVIEYMDPSGRKRRWVADMATATDPRGMAVRLRVDGGRPQVVSELPNQVTLAMATVVTMLVAAGCITAGLTGKLFAALPVPGL